MIPGVDLSEESDHDELQSLSEKTETEYKSDPADVDSDTSVNVVLQDWLTISSASFRNQKKFPILRTEQDGNQDISIVTTQPQFQRLNFFNFNMLPTASRPPKKNVLAPKKKNDPYAKHKNLNKKQDNSKVDYFWFWFRASERYMYYSSNPIHINQLQTFDFHAIVMARGLPKKKNCFEIGDKTSAMYRICAVDEKTKAKWLCYIQGILKITVKDESCYPKGHNNPSYQEKIVVQPVMLIPTATRHCNDKWDYAKHGKDWECKCSEGMFFIINFS